MSSEVPPHLSQILPHLFVPRRITFVQKIIDPELYTILPGLQCLLFPGTQQQVYMVLTLSLPATPGHIHLNYVLKKMGQMDCINNLHSLSRCHPLSIVRCGIRRLEP